MSKPRALTPAQRRVVEFMLAGRELTWFGDNGPEMRGYPFWPQKRTVRAMLRDGWLKWGDWRNDSQREAGICPLELTERARVWEGIKAAMGPKGGAPCSTD